MKASTIMFRGQACAIEDAVEAWKAGHDDSMRVRDLEMIVGVAVQLAASLEHQQAMTWKALFEDMKFDTQSAGLAMLKNHKRLAPALEELLVAVATVESDGFTVEGAGALREASARLARLREDFEKRWPMFDPAQLTAILEAAKRGEFASEEDLRALLDAHPQ